jgi:hypothetical protein
MIKDHPNTRRLFNAANAARALVSGRPIPPPLLLFPERPPGPAPSMVALRQERERER